MTVFACKDNATVASPACEEEVLEAVLRPALESHSWGDTGGHGASVLPPHASRFAVAERQDTARSSSWQLPTTHCLLQAFGLFRWAP